MQEETENLQSEFEYPINPEVIESPTEKLPVEPDWIYPKDFDINAIPENMEDSLLMKYHDLTHIYFEKILKGSELNYSFNDLIILHYKIIKEYEKRDLIHFEPINSLDSIHFSNREYQGYISNLNKESTENPKTEVNLSFSNPTILI